MEITFNLCIEISLLAPGIRQKLRKIEFISNLRINHPFTLGSGNLVTGFKFDLDQRLTTATTNKYFLPQTSP